MSEESQLRENTPNDSEAELAKIMRLQYYFGGLNAVNWSLCLGAPLILLAGKWGANPFQIGILASFVYIFSPIQVLANVLLGQLGCKKMMLSGWSSRNLFILPVPLMILFTGMEPADWKIYVMIFSLGCFGLFRSIGLTAQMPWIYGLISSERRGRFLSSYMMVVNLSGATIFLSSAGVFYAFSEQSAFGMIFSIALACGFIAAFVLSRLPDVEKPESLSLKEIGQLCLQFAREPSAFRRATMIWAGYFAFAAPLIPFLIYYVSTEGIFNSEQAMLMALLNFIGGIMGAWFSRSWLDLLGIRFLSALALGGFAGVMVVLLILVWSTWTNGEPIPGMGVAMYATVFTCGVFSSIWYTISMKMQPYIAVERTRALQVSVFYASGTFAAGISSMVWGFLFRIPIESGSEVNIPLFLVYLSLSCLIFLVSSCLMARLSIQEAVPRPMNFLARVFPRK